MTTTAVTAQDSSLTVWDPTKASLQTKLGELVQYFQVSIPTTGDNLPRAYIDPTVINATLLSIEHPDDVPDTIIQEATIPIEFEEGYPTVGGIPLWERLDGEPIPYYKLFKEYREMRYIQGTRSIAKLAEASGMPGKHLNALARVYHWQMRARACDIFKEYERQLARQRQVIELESKHAKVSNDLLDQAVTYLLNHPEQMSPKTAIQLAELAMRSGRLALGLNPDKPGSQGATHETNIMIANTNNSAENMLSIGGGQGGGPAVPGSNASVGGGNGQHASIHIVGGGAKDTQHLRDILQVLSKSGAFHQAQGKPQPQHNSRGDVIDVTPEADTDTDTDIDADADPEAEGKNPYDNIIDITAK